MLTPTLIWIAVAVMIALLIIFNICQALLISRHAVVRSARDREIFFVPGDPIHSDDDSDEAM